MPLRFHWSLSSAGESRRGARARAEQSGLPPFDLYRDFCRQAERSGIESLLMAFGFHRADPVALSAALGAATERIVFLVAMRAGVVSPTYFVQQVNTVAALTGGRIAINIVAGHTPREHGYYGDFLDHDQRYERLDEFWTVCHALWDGGEVDFAGRHYRIEGGRLRTPYVGAGGRTRPEIFLGGGSPEAARLAVAHADCMFRLPRAPEAMAAEVAPLLDAGTEVGLLVSLIARPTRDEALAAARELVAGCGERARDVHRDFARRSDSVAFRSTYEVAGGGEEWLTRTLWTGAVPYLGAPAIALVGSYDEIAEALGDYARVGVSHFLFMGWPDYDEMTRFGEHVLPLVGRPQRPLRPPSAAGLPVPGSWAVPAVGAGRRGR
jgi:alkanesulfonate monooxygenase